MNTISRRSFLKGAAASALSVGMLGMLPAVSFADGEETLVPSTSLETDVAIIGAGAAGLTAAMGIVDAGLSCIVVEKGANVGTCNASMAGGPAMAETCVQAAEGETVSVETLFKYMYDFSNMTVNGSLLRNVIGCGGPTVDKMVEVGVEMYLRPDVYGAGFRARHGFNQGGVARFAPIQEYVEANGGSFLFNNAGAKLIQDGDTVTGILCVDTESGDVTQINAKAVLIATGGYLGNEDMIHEHFGNIKLNPLGNTKSDGAGINMVLEAGGIKDRNWAICGNEFAGSNQKAGGWWFNFNQNFKWPVYGGLLVNRNGERFMNEEIFAKKALSLGGEASVREGLFYSVIDEKYMQGVAEKGIVEYLGGNLENWYVGVMSIGDAKLDQAPETVQEAIDQGWAYKADTIEELAEYFGLTNLPETVAAYNAACESGMDEQFYKDPMFLQPVAEGPFYVFEYEPSAWCTFGGVKVDNCLRAMNADQQVIPGLYVAGVDAGSMYTSPYYINEGATLGLSFASGTYAAKKIAEYIG